MNKVAKKRLCWNCEGNVSVDAETCPFCGVSVVPASLDGTGNSFVPPYAAPSIHQNTEVHRSPYSVAATPVPEMGTREAKEAEEIEPSTDEFKKVVISVALLLGGSVFFLFGLALFLFSNNGIFSLHWNGAIWFVYTFMSLPMLFFGWKALMKLE